MKYSLYLLTVSFLAAAPLAASADPGCSCAAGNQTSAPIASQVPVNGPTLSFRDRMRAAFGLPPLARTSQTVIVPQAVTNEPPAIARMSHTVNYQGSNPQAAVPVIAQPSLQVSTKYQDKVGHETDYSWITGHLFYVHTDGGKWVLRYTAIDEVDRYGGSVVLTPTVEMRNYREGDLVNVFGEVLNNGQSVRPLGGALYRVNSIQMVERADP